MRARREPRPRPRLRWTLAAAGLALAAAIVTGRARPAAGGGGDWVYPAQDSYDPGETATMVGYTMLPAPGRGVDDGPYYGYLRADPDAVASDWPATWPIVHPTDVPLGPTTVIETGRPGWDPFAVRLSITFTVPQDLAPGTYEVLVCNDPCTHSLGEIIGGSLFVGVAPSEPVYREWLTDDPAVALLDDDDLVGGFPVRDIRAGRVPVQPEQLAIPAPLPAVTGWPTTLAGPDDTVARREPGGQNDGAAAGAGGRAAPSSDGISASSDGVSARDLALAVAGVVIGGLVTADAMRRFRAGPRRPRRRVVRPGPDGTTPSSPAHRADIELVPGELVLEAADPDRVRVDASRIKL